MPMFVDPNSRVPVTVGENTVHIKAKMDAATVAAVQDEIAARGTGDVSMTGLGSYRLALLVHNIVGWEGPDFVDQNGRPVPCNRANIGRLNPDDPLIQAVADEIGKRNARPGPVSADPL